MVGDEKVSLVIPFRCPLRPIYVNNTLAIIKQIETLAESEVDDGDTSDETD
jgi:hypothetical protein